MNSCNTDRFLATTVVYGLSTLNSENISNIVVIIKSKAVKRVPANENLVLECSRMLICQ